MSKSDIEINDFTIIVNSCDKYRQTWEPFFKLFKKNWSSCKYNIVLNTETETLQESYGLNITTINSPSKYSWSKRLLNVLRKIDSTYVLFLLDDEFLLSQVSVHDFETALSYLRDNKDVGYILLRHSEKQKVLMEERFFERSKITEKYLIVLLSSLWRKDYLMKLLRSHESPWDFERFANRRALRMKYKIMQYSNSFPVIFDYDDRSIGLQRGKWLPDTKSMLESNNIYIDYDVLGWSDWKLGQQTIAPKVSFVKDLIKRIRSFF